MAHQELVDCAGGASAFGDAPDDQGLSAAAIARGEHAFGVGRLVTVLRFEVAAGVTLESKLFGESVLGA